MSDTRIDFLYLSEPDMIEAGVNDMEKCVETMCEVYRLMGEGDLPVDDAMSALRSINYEGYISLDWGEERRLAYVAVTRAKKKLYITRAKQRMLFGQTRFNQPSRFIREIPDSLLDITGETLKTSFASTDIKATPSRPQTPSRGFTSTPSYSAPAKNTTVFNVGDTVMHKAYGEGVVLSAKPMGNDTLLEIAFTNSGTKKIMANFAKVEKI